MEDLNGIELAANSLERHDNSCDELRLAHEILSDGDVRSTARLSASAVDACLKHLVEAGDLAMALGELQFNQESNMFLKLLGKPSFLASQPNLSKQLFHRDRDKSSMHEGDCFYKDNNDTVIKVIQVEHTKVLFRAPQVCNFLIESLV